MRGWLVARDLSFWDNAPRLVSLPEHDEHPASMPNGLDESGNLESLFRLAAEHADMRGPPRAAEPEIAKDDRPQALWAVTEPWDPATIPVRPWIARGYLMRGAVTVVSGAGSAGKSSLMNSWAAAMVTGRGFARIDPVEPLRAATYNVEDDEDEQKRRFSGVFQRLGLDLSAFGDRLAILGPTGIGTLLQAGSDGRMIVNTRVMDDIEAFFEEFRPDVAMFDPFVELHAAEENDNTAVRSVMARFRRLAAQYKCAVVILHHSRKGMGDAGDPETLRGASSIVGAARVVLTVNVMTKEEAASFGIDEKHRRDYFRLDGAKSNYAPIEDAEWFKREVVTLPNGGDGEAPDGVAVAWPWRPPSVMPAATDADLNACLDILAEPPAGWLYAPTQVGSNSHRWAGTVLVHKLNCSEAQAKMLIRKWLKDGLLYTETYRDDAQRKDRTGVRVNNDRRPT